MESGTGDAAGGQRWWHGGVLYQVYVRSWRDSDGDGYGDLNGIIERLDYLAWLGVDGIWLSPTMPSPDEDWGYDVSDYLAVHPELGDMAVMDRLIAQAANRGIRVILDLVPNHTSTAHPWFADATRGRDAAHRDYYLWADPAPGGGAGHPPNNWEDTAGHSAWAWHEPTGQYYLHLFLASQADLNWREPAVHREFEQILRFWFDRGWPGCGSTWRTACTRTRSCGTTPTAAAWAPPGAGPARPLSTAPASRRCTGSTGPGGR